MPMKTTTHARLRRTAAEAVRSVPGVEAVVLFGSRARGTARQASDWDIAILSRAAPADERAARKLFGALERVHPIEREIVDAAGLVEEMRGFDRLDPVRQARVRAWGEEGRSIGSVFDVEREQAP